MPANGFQIIAPTLNKVMTTKPTTRQDTASNLATVRPRGAYRQKTSSRGGARPGAGRKKGSTPRYTLESLMAEIATATGRPFAEQVAQNYAAAIAREDYAGIRDYDKVLLGKMVADRQEITVDNSEDVRQAKEEAFSEALKSLSTVAVLNTRTKTGT